MLSVKGYTFHAAVAGLVFGIDHELMLAREAFLIKRIYKCFVFIIGKPKPAAVQFSPHIFNPAEIIPYGKSNAGGFLQVGPIGKADRNDLGGLGIDDQHERSEPTEPGIGPFVLPLNLLHISTGAGSQLHDGSLFRFIGEFGLGADHDQHGIM